MTSIQDLLDASPMFQSLSDTGKQRFRKRLKKEITKYQRPAKGGEDPTGDDLLASFDITQNNVKKVLQAIDSVISFSWLAFFFGPLWAAHKRVPLITTLYYICIILAPVTLLFSIGAYQTVQLFLGPFSVAIFVIAAIKGRSMAIRHDAATMLEGRLGMPLLSNTDKCLQKLLLSNKPWMRVMIVLAIFFGIIALDIVLGIAIYGDAYLNMGLFPSDATA